MEASSQHWLPLTEYAARSGTSISTLRRKIKSQTIEFRMEEGRYLIRSDELVADSGFQSNDLSSPLTGPRRTDQPAASKPHGSVDVEAELRAELARLGRELAGQSQDGHLRWRALEARVAGLARKLDFFAEQIAETRMLIKLFEEKLDRRV